jgi:uncharacterized protein
VSFLRVLIASFTALGVISSATAHAQTRSVPPTPSTHVTDSGGFLSVTARGELEARLAAYQETTGRQVVLWIGQRAFAHESIEEWAARVFAAWGVGTRGRDDGVVLFILPDERKLRIEVGYGLEGILPDVRAAQIIRDRISPLLTKGDRDGAARAGISAVLGALGGESARFAQPKPVTPSRRISWFETVVFATGMLVLLVLFVTHPRLALSLLFAMFSGGSRPGGGGGHRRGGFSGGGGRSGGGGASGSW